MRFRRAGSLGALMAVMVLADRLTKAWASVALRQKSLCWDGVFRLAYAENTGAAFSMFSGSGWLLIGVTAAVLAAVAWWLIARRPQGCMAAGLSLILAGGMSNLFDRIVYGHVVDFIEPLFVRFAVFNAADVGVCTGAGLLLLGMWLQERRGKA